MTGQLKNFYELFTWTSITLNPKTTSGWYNYAIEKFSRAIQKLPESHKDGSSKSGYINNLAAVFKN
jgi:hypothetical protein